MQPIKSLEEYQQAYKESLENPENFWAKIAETFQWKKTFSKTFSGDYQGLDFKWFEDGTLNITDNCLDRHAKKNPDKVALIFEPNDSDATARTYTYSELLKEVSTFANGLKSVGVKKGDRVVFYMSQIPQLLFGVLACARIGATHSVVFAGFSAKALADRIKDCQAEILITNDEGLRGNKTIPLKKICDEAKEQTSLLKKVIVHRHTGADINWDEKCDVWLHDVLKDQSSECTSVEVESEHPLFILYTSGSTGAPKGLVHSTAGYMVWAQFTFQNVFQVKDDDRFFCTADIGWITGHTYLTYGPLLNGTTTVMYEGVPTYPDAGRWWEIVDKHQVTHFYTAPTAIRSLEACDARLVEKHDLTSLKVLGSVGEPINAEAWDWYNTKVGKEKSPIVDTWWQTETGGILISAMAGVTPSKKTFAGLPLPGVFPEILDHQGNILKGETEGNLCLSRPWPGQARGIWRDQERFKMTYFSQFKNYYFTGDGARRDQEGHYRITGRVDDVINVSGHRLSTAEIENALNLHPNIVESAVVGFPHSVKGQCIFAYLVLSDPSQGENGLKEAIKELIEKEIGPFARPDHWLVVSSLPKTRSGKIMRRILRKCAAGEGDQLGDTSTLVDPSVVEEIKEKYLELDIN